MIEWAQKWKTWKKHNRNSIVYQLLVLIKIIRSPTLELQLSDKQIEELKKVINGDEQ